VATTAAGIAAAIVGVATSAAPGVAGVAAGKPATDAAAEASHGFRAGQARPTSFTSPISALLARKQ
jgi:hypothetical protein